MGSVKLRLGKKDAVLKLWFEMARQRQDNLSAAVAEALLYYVRNGVYLKIANIPKEVMKDMPDEYKCLSFAENTPVSRWLREKEEEGQKVSTSIKRVLRASITTDEEPLMLLSSDELCTINDRKQRGLAAETVVERFTPMEAFGKDKGQEREEQPLQSVQAPESEKAEEDPVELWQVQSEKEEESTENLPSKKREEPKRSGRGTGLIDNLITEGLNL